jgi:amino acid transporter
VILVTVVTVLAILGVDVIGNLSVVVALLVTSPFLVTLVWGGVVGWIQPARDWTAPPPGAFGNLTWADAGEPRQLEAINRGLHVVIWSFTGYDSLGNIVMSLAPPHHFPRAALGAIVLSFLTYSTALLGLLGAPAPNSALPNFSLWRAGYFSQAAYELGGVALRTIMTLAALLSCYGTFQALMVPIGEQLCELTSPKYLDIALFQRKSRFGTPHVAIVFCALVCIGGSYLPIEALIDSLNILHSTVLFLVCLCYVILRFSPAGRMIPRTFRAVGSNVFVPLLVFFPLVISSWMVIGIAWLTTWIAAVAAAGVYLIGLALYFSCGLRKRRGWLWATPTPEALVRDVKVRERDDSPLLGRRAKVNVQ